MFTVRVGSPVSLQGADRLTPQSGEVSCTPRKKFRVETATFWSAPKLDPHVLAKLDEAASWPCCRDQRRSRWLADRIPSSVDSFAHAGARCHATRQHCSRDEAPRHPRRWLVLLLLRVGSSRRATSGTSTAFISNRADDSLVVAYLKG